MELSLENTNNKIATSKDELDNLTTDLKKFLEKSENIQIESKTQYNFIDQSERYQDFWEDSTGLEERVCMTLGISRYNRDNKFFDQLYKAVEESIFEISQKEGTAIYVAFGPEGLLQTSPKGRHVTKTVYNVDKYENGEIEQTRNIQMPELPKTMDDNGNFRNIVLQMDEKGKITIRDDLKNEIINLACEKCKDLREQTIQESEEYKKEGHLYEVHEYDGYVFLDDITEENYSFEDIDFVVDNFKGEGTYQVIDGVYTKISDEFYSEKE